MENSELADVVDQSNEFVKSKSLPVKKNPVPSTQDILTKIQQQSIERDSVLQRVEEDFSVIENTKNFVALLEKDKQKAKIIIDDLVSSANKITSTIASSLTSSPSHPYEKLIYEYLGPNYEPTDIRHCSIPEHYNPYVSIKDLRAIAEANQQLQVTQLAALSAEASSQTFDGTFDTANLNNAFAECVTDSNGNQRFIVNEVRLKEHLEFIEMVKSIPKEYILKNPLEVAKKMTSEFVRIHKPTLNVDSKDDLAGPTITIQEIFNNPFEVTKKLFEGYQQLDGLNGSLGFESFFKSLNKEQLISR